MKENVRAGLFASLFVLIGFPIIFTVSSIVTGDWRYLIYSIGPILTAGLTGLLFTLHLMKKKSEIR
ncbi:hypothetical protein [Fictibacillus sp. BK138]|uniref:hypothetical protein n=1 Tax=Fictibacillus sp. BK138 TaxID=2512121 RepID=UPI0010295D88|nr:hypothetical protein [Fictibacillus sp. BK138]RZT23453.1 hypothetical protein EV282_2543 [Fictibacillus sp. BK138]